jgi:hypothetical protein
MRRIVLLAAAVVVALAGRGDAQTVTYYLHKAASAVPVPGGDTIFIMDDVAPTAPTPVAESVSAPKGASPSFQTFYHPTFAAPVTLGMDFDVTVFVSANLAMKSGCAFFSATIDRVDSTGVRIPIARGSVQTTLPQGGSGGTVGFVPVVIPVGVGCDRPTDDVTFEAGESIAVTVTAANACKANRTIFLAYDGGAATTSAAFSPSLPPDEVFFRACYAKCQQGTSKAVSKFVNAKNKCVTKCVTNAIKGLNPVSECNPPYGGITAYCITDPLRGAEAKALAAIRKVCVTPNGCPPCYSPDGNCTTHSEDTVQNFEGMADSFVPGVYCDPAPTKERFKCMTYNGRALWKMWASRWKCYDKCYSNEAKGRAAPNSCNPPATDPPTVTCVEVARSKAALAIDKYCALPGFSPDCGFAYPTGTEWSNLMGLAVDGSVGPNYCGD